MSIIQGNFFFLNKKKENKGGQDKETAIRDSKLPVKQFCFLKSCSLCDIGFSLLIVCFVLFFLFFFNLLIQKNKVICPACLENLIDGAKGRRDQRKARCPLKKTTAWIRNTRKETRSCYKNETCERFVSSVDISRTLLLFRVVTLGAGYVHGSRVLKAEM